MNWYDYNHIEDLTSKLGDRVAELYNHGYSIKDIQQILYLTEIEVKNILRKKKVALRNQKGWNTRVNKDKLIEKAEELLDKIDIEKFKTKRNLINYLCKKLGVSSWFIRKYINIDRVFNED